MDLWLGSSFRNGCKGPRPQDTVSGLEKYIAKPLEPFEVNSFHGHPLFTIGGGLLAAAHSTFFSIGVLLSVIVNRVKYLGETFLGEVAKLYYQPAPKISKTKSHLVLPEASKA
jgi:hypothetical protein